MKRNVLASAVVAGVVLTLCSCSLPSRMTSQKGQAMIEKKPFGQVDGQNVDLYVLTNANGLKASITNYGGIMTSLIVPDKNGKMEDILLGYDNVAAYVKETPYFNALIGRYGNRIGKAKFTLDGKTYTLAANDKENSLHGGVKGFDKVIWTAEGIQTDHGVGVKLAYLSKDMEEGYPGNLLVNVTYMLTNNNELIIEYRAMTDKATVCNLTNHNYYNLTGNAKDSILNHVLMINADKFTPVDAGLIPTGELRPVKGTPMDFTKPSVIGARVNDADEQIKFGGGYDHNWVLNKKGGEMSLAATLYEPTSGRVMEVWTEEPGVQFYSGNFLNGTITGKGGVVYKQRWGMCLETQHFPDSPNKPHFPTTTLRPGELYQTKTVHKFYTR
ncbi:aldose epimerase family protein [Anaerohalosphaeraceae bacterium U12dextr]